MSTIGFKGLDSNFCCRGYRFRIGRRHSKRTPLSLCHNGFHFCREFRNVFNFYPWIATPPNRYALVDAVGDVVDSTDGRKSVTNGIIIIRELSRRDVCEYLNDGDDNTGLFNKGRCNAGNMNIGDLNDGYGNIGSFNAGCGNIGEGNGGCYNTGNSNSGWFNVGSGCSGWFNIGTGEAGAFNLPWEGQFNMPSWLHAVCMEIELTQTCTMTLDNDTKARIGIDRGVHHGTTISAYGSQGLHAAIRDAAYKYIMKFYGDVASPMKDIVAETESMPNFDWDMFDEITGISRPWLIDAVARARSGGDKLN